MKEFWDKFYEALAEVQDEIEELLPELPQSKNFNQRATSLKRKWVLAQKLANDLNEMIMYPRGSKIIFLEYFQKEASRVAADARGDQNDLGNDLRRKYEGHR